MSTLWPRRELVAVLAAGITMIVGMAVLSKLLEWKVADLSVVFVTLLLFPILVFALVSGTLSEIGGPGGWKLKFSAMQTIGEHDWIPRVDAKLEKIRGKTDEQLANELRKQPTVLVATLADKKNLCQGLDMITRRFGWDAVRYLVFEDPPDRFHSMVPLKSISQHKELIDEDGGCQAGDLVEWIRDESPKLRELRGFVGEGDAVRPQWTRQDCLKKMLELDCDALPVVRQARLQGIVERSSLVVSIVANLRS